MPLFRAQAMLIPDGTVPSSFIHTHTHWYHTTVHGYIQNLKSEKKWEGDKGEIISEHMASGKQFTIGFRHFSSFLANLPKVSKNFSPVPSPLPSTDLLSSLSPPLCLDPTHTLLVSLRSSSGTNTRPLSLSLQNITRNSSIHSMIAKQNSDANCLQNFYHVTRREQLRACLRSHSQCYPTSSQKSVHTFLPFTETEAHWQPADQEEHNRKLTLRRLRCVRQRGYKWLVQWSQDVAC